MTATGLEQSPTHDLSSQVGEGQMVAYSWGQLGLMLRSPFSGSILKLLALLALM